MWPGCGLQYHNRTESFHLPYDKTLRFRDLIDASLTMLSTDSFRKWHQRHHGSNENVHKSKRSATFDSDSNVFHRQKRASLNDLVDEKDIASFHGIDENSVNLQDSPTDDTLQVHNAAPSTASDHANESIEKTTVSSKETSTLANSNNNRGSKILDSMTVAEHHKDKAADLVMMYFPQPDRVGHKFGTNSPQLASVLRRVR